MEINKICPSTWKECEAPDHAKCSTTCWLDDQMKPCPFCGTAGKIVTIAETIYVGCLNIHCLVSAEVSGNKMTHTGKELIENWNKRS